MMADDQDNPLSAEPTWVVPVGALSFGGVVWLLMAGIQVFMFSGLGWRWLLALSPHIVFIEYGGLVNFIRFFKITDDAVTVYSWGGLRRKHIRLDSIDCVYGRWGVDGRGWYGNREQYFPTVYVRCHDGQVIKLNEGRLKLCRRLITQIRRRLPANGSQESSPRCVLPDLADPLQARLVEWLWDYVTGLFGLGFHVLLLRLFLRDKGIL
ncbi:MAG: hypothetical protein ILO10_01055 [Kiritimatiellae bacterium]|nr:hypothetical protein [Kiritimatiellia bacterium]